MSVEAAELALLYEDYEPTGDRITDMILSAFANIPYEGYNNEFYGINRREHAWCHAKLSGTSFPTLSLIDGSGEYVSGYKLTHRIFYATDFGRSPIENSEAVDLVISEMAKTNITDDLFIEYGICLVALGQQCPSLAITIANANFSHSEDHLDIVARLLLKRV